ncbi:MAG: tyrosine-type recombinase/integrase [Candidatus Hodarchaeales archaeon]
MTRLVEGFLLTCTVEGKSPNTVTFYKGILNNFFWYLNEFNFTIVSPMVIRQFLSYILTTDNRWGSDNSRATKKASQVTVQRYYTGLKVFFNWCINENYIDISPMANLKKPKAPKKVIKAISPQDVASLIALLKGRDFKSIRNRAILLTALDTGLRLSELCSLRVTDVLNETITIVGKGAKQRIIRIGANASKAIWRYKMVREQRVDNTDALWISRSGKPLGPEGIQHTVVNLGRKIGIKLSPHMLRHTFALYYLRNGGDVFTLQTLLGHSTLEIVKGYLGSLNSEDAIRSHRLYSPMDNFYKIQ